MNPKQTAKQREGRYAWLLEEPPIPKIDVFDWISRNRQELEKNVSRHDNFLTACGEANLAPQKKFLELMEPFLNPPDEYWEEFRNTFRQSILTQNQRKWIPEAELGRFIENALFSSFSRLVRKSVPKKLA